MILIFVAGLAAGVPCAPDESFASLSAFISFVSTDYSSSRVPIFCFAPDGDDRTASPSRGSRVGYLYMGRLGAPTRGAQKANFKANWIRRGGRDERT